MPLREGQDNAGHSRNPEVAAPHVVVAEMESHASSHSAIEKGL
jgi:hypothetical protein